jgi:hypothetical protein
MTEVLQTRLRSDPVAVERELASGSSAELIHSLCACVSSIHPEVHTSLVVTVMRTPWRESEALAGAVLDFAQELVSASPAFLKPCVDALIGAFLPTDTPSASGAIGTHEAVIPRVHVALRGIIRACPLGIGCATRALTAARARLAALRLPLRCTMHLLHLR